ncbi:hypothetical protein GMORB2_4805 [Geosmithia morbida]|uniref:Uncharacterized protein n=1 Tax=Geosmithia morbida TaxID=1094350 RepID=A0A9P4YLQ4_9HYPO|nr:uncharacterized protein GMORB2_4805 [Geosmithia morbida]KAF4119286.1 hypothetical protein GMORB2_4805 [Geosmithia morbida]
MTSGRNHWSVTLLPETFCIVSAVLGAYITDISHS